MTVSISPAEWEVMRILWRGEPSSAEAIIRALPTSTGWQPKTVKSLLSRLVKKKAIGFDRSGREYIYSPRVSEKEIVRDETQSFLDRVFGGSLAPMVARLADDGALSSEEIAELRSILEKNEPAGTKG